ncbi:CNBP [Mytilus coruscus]|uniref:CNBP n=1 Tax=Mytilus coruscus TaxID=42192 RepID=A0A6J8BXU4_MYTCO|nr:CNBP [Mytilus coruscus]
MADEDYQQLVDTLKEMHIKPKADTPEALQQWIEAYAMETLQMEKQKQPIKTESSSSSTSSHYTQPPRINIFSGSSEKKGALRKIEKEHNLDELPKVKATSKQAIANEKEEESELAATLKQINTRLQQLESGQPNKQQDQPNQQQQDTQPQPYQQPFSQNQFRGRGFNRGGRGNRGYERSYGRGYGRGYGRCYGGGFGQNQHQSTSDNTYRFQPIACYRCGRDSHIARGCRANTDVNGKPLN